MIGTGKCNVTKQTTRCVFGIALLRTLVASLMIVHGSDKAINFHVYVRDFPQVLGISGTLGLAITTIAQLPLMIPVAFGYYTRLCALPAFAVLLVAFVFHHSLRFHGNSELALLYSICLGVLILSPGPDLLTMLRHCRERKSQPTVNVTCGERRPQ